MVAVRSTNGFLVFEQWRAAPIVAVAAARSKIGRFLIPSVSAEDVLALIRVQQDHTAHLVFVLCWYHLVNSSKSKKSHIHHDRLHWISTAAGLVRLVETAGGWPLGDSFTSSGPVCCVSAAILYSASQVSKSPAKGKAVEEARKYIEQQYGDGLLMSTPILDLKTYDTALTQRMPVVFKKTAKKAIENVEAFTNELLALQRNNKEVKNAA